MDELAEQLLFVLGHFGLQRVIGFGVGAGGNVLARFSLQHPEKVEALCLINCVSTTAGWIEWGYQKLNARHLRSKGMTQSVLDYLMWHHFGRVSKDREILTESESPDAHGVLAPSAGHGGEEPRLNSSVQGLLRASRKPDKPRAIHRFIYSTN